MLEVLQGHIIKRLGRVPERFEEVAKAFEPLRPRRGTYLLREAEVCKYVYQIYQQILELSYSNTVYRVNTLTSLDALERIKWLMEHKPKLMTRLSSKLIASYLGISPETMTRLKGKL